jgi:hypothetical protein
MRVFPPIANISRAWPAPTKFDIGQFNAWDIFIALSVACCTSYRQNEKHSERNAMTDKRIAQQFHATVDSICQQDYAIFQDHGYRGLYGGLAAKDIHARKGLKKSQKIIDHMGSTELAANLFRTTQTEEKLKRDQVRGKQQANQTHFEVGKKVRANIKDLGCTMPEALPTPDFSIKQIENSKKKLEKNSKES